MRIFERLMYLFGCSLAILYFYEMYLWCYINAAVIVTLTVIGGMYEGIRYPQWLFLLGFTAHLVLICLNVYNIFALIIYCTFLAFAIGMTIMFGEANLDRIKIDGPWQVGHKDLF